MGKSETMAGESAERTAEKLNSLGDKYYYGEGVEVDYTKAFECFMESAKLGYAEAMYNVGFCYETGKGVDENDSKAFWFYRRSALRGFHKGEYRYGVMLREGRGTGADPKKGAEYLRKASRQGNMNAMYELATMYALGDGVTKNEFKATELFLKVAESGNARAQTEIGFRFSQGIGTDADQEMSVFWSKKAADNGDELAMYNYALHLLDGNGIAADVDAALEWLKKSFEAGNVIAAEHLERIYIEGVYVEEDLKEADVWNKRAKMQKKSEMRSEGSKKGAKFYNDDFELMMDAAHAGNAQAQYDVAEAFRTGKEVPRNMRIAREWLRKSADNGLPVAQFYYSSILKDEPIKRIEYLRKAAEGGFDQAQCKLGLTYWKGEDVKHDRTKAVFWFTKAAEQGNADAHDWLGWICQGKKGCRDPVGAEMHYRISAESGNPHAILNLAEMYFLGNGVDADPREAFALYRVGAYADDPRCMWPLGDCYKEGIGTPASPGEAFKWFDRSAEKGNKTGRFKLAQCYIDGFGTEQDVPLGIDMLDQLAEANYSLAMAEISRISAEGILVPQDRGRALEYLLMGVDLRSCKCMERLAMEYLLGRITRQSDRVAVKWLRESVKRDSTSTNLDKLGTMHFLGLGMKRDYAKAFDCYRDASGKGNGHSMYMLGRMYAEGLGTGIDAEKAEECFVRAVELGSVQAAMMMAGRKEHRPSENAFHQNGNYLIGVHLFLAGEYDHAASVLEHCDCGNQAEKHVMLGMMHLLGLVKDSSDSGAFRHLSMIASDTQEGSDLLGMMYMEGRGTDADPVKAMAYLCRGMDVFSPISAECLGKMYSEGTAVRVSEKTARRYGEMAHALAYDAGETE